MNYLTIRNIIALVCLCIFTSLSTLMAQVQPGVDQENPIAIVGATAHIGDGTAIKNSVVLFDAGKLVYVGDASAAPDYSSFQVIKAEGKDVYPGFIAMNTRLGIVEIDAVHASADKREVGFFNPNARTLIAFNTDSEVIPTVRNLGVLIAQVAPEGPGLTGQSSALTLDGWNWEDAGIGPDEGMYLNWPKTFYQTGWWANPGGLKKNEKYKENVQKLESYFMQAKAYAADQNPAVQNLRFNSMRALFTGKRKLYIMVNYAREIEDAIYFAEKLGVKPILVGAGDAYLVKELIVEKKIPVVLGAVHALPMRGHDLVSQPFETPALLNKAGVPIAFSINGAWEQRHVPHNAGHAVGFGIPYEDVVKGLTLTPATMMGIDDKVGSLQKGKHATLFISSGDALDMRTNKIEKAWIQGRVVDLSSRQTKLADKYKAKYKNKK